MLSRNDPTIVYHTELFYWKIMLQRGTFSLIFLCGYAILKCPSREAQEVIAQDFVSFPGC